MRRQYKKYIDNEQKEALLLICWHGKTVAEVSREMAISESTLRRWLKGEGTGNDDGSLEFEVATYRHWPMAKSYDRILKLLHVAYEKGDPDAAYTLGEFYSEGPRENEELARKFLCEAIQVGDHRATYFLAREYDNKTDQALEWMICALQSPYDWSMCGFGYAWEVQMALLEWIVQAGALCPDRMHKAAEWGFMPAMYRCATNYYLGRDTEQNYVLAMELYQKVAVENKHLAFVYGSPVGLSGCFRIAKIKIGFMYYYGLGVEKNKELALKWYREAAEGQMPKEEWELIEAMEWEVLHECELAQTYPVLDSEWSQAYPALGGIELWPCRSNDNTSPDREYAFLWFLKDAQRGHPHAMYQVGSLYRVGLGVEQNRSFAHDWYLKAAEQGHSNAMCMQGRLLVEKEEYTAAFEWFLKAAQADNAVAMYFVAHMYFDGEGVEKSAVESFKWMLKAAQQGQWESMVWLGLKYRRGDGVTEDEELARTWFRQVAEAEKWEEFSGEATCILAHVYFYGDGVELDKQKAFRLYSEAAEQGVLLAMTTVGCMYLYGDGIKQDQSAGYRYLSQAAGLGDESAQEILTRLRDTKREERKGGKMEIQWTNNSGQTTQESIEGVWQKMKSLTTNRYSEEKEIQ